MSLSRFNRNGRDFLQENKQKVSQWETNGRLTAAAAAKRVNLWRPVVLHYAEKLRPHGQRHYIAPHGSSKMYTGLSNPYGLQHQDQYSGKQIEEQKALREEEAKMRQGGGYCDRIAEEQMPLNQKKPQQQKPYQQQMKQTQTQTEEIKDSCFLKKSLEKCEKESEKTQQTEQSDQVEPTQSFDNVVDDDALSVYSIKSKASQRSNISRISEKSQHLMENDEIPDAPLSARSNASLKTIRSTATVKSGCSIKSNATIKSIQSVKSQASIKSHISNKSNATIKSHISEKSNASIRSDKSKASIRSDKSKVSIRSDKSNVSIRSEKSRTSIKSDASRQAGGETSGMEGYQQMQNERQIALNDAHFKYSKLIDEYNHLPVSESTLRVRNRKIAIERELDQLDYAINMYDYNPMYYKR